MCYRHCKKVVTFIDDVGIKIQTSRGEKEYEFDQVHLMFFSRFYLIFHVKLQIYGHFVLNNTLTIYFCYSSLFSIDL